ncbi:MAG TPA: PBP1A family penicillin-binding protein [Bryobacteraceae bacterium]|nr:PBP1A family penicillin-binding protein [Bryobacteraceae bacterium]
MRRRHSRVLISAGFFSVFLGLIIFCVCYLSFAKRIDRRLSAGPFSDSVNIYSAPRIVAVGDSLTLEQVVHQLRQAGYGTARSNPVGWYHERSGAIEIFPGRDAKPGQEPCVMEFSKGTVSRIVSLADNTVRPSYEFQPQLIDNLSQGREKRRLVHFADIPPLLVHAVISAEDKHFFQHTGFDYFRIIKAAYVDVKDGRKAQGASTLSMQLARGLWLDSDKSWKRKFEELLITIHLEHKLTKQQIFEDYANQVYLGWHDTFSINGFGQAARVYFGKDLSQLTVPEAALLAGLVQRPSYYNPFRYPARARERRDFVLSQMRENGYLNDDQYDQAAAAPVHLAAGTSDGMGAQYFVDLMNQELQAHFDDHEKQTRYIYTTLDPVLQRAAEDAVRTGMQAVDHQLKARRKSVHGKPQVALIALDPHTGEIKALVGGRNYSTSQLNHVLAMRQPGSVFKPFVYAAAMSTAIGPSSEIFTPDSVIDDSPTTFYFDNGTYQPDNFGHDFMGEVTLRTALAHSLNVATVKLAEQVGYRNVVALARSAGLNGAIQPTPAVALGAYDATPLEIAGAYTVFANHGVRVDPSLVSLIRGPDGKVIYSHEANARQVLDPRVAYLVVNMMQDVLNSGTGAGVRARGFELPAAGKTGTSRDGWFAGFTSQLLCVVWVGFDDNSDLGLEGAHSALPIWTAFMKRAAQLRPYRDAREFPQPSGIVTVPICSDSGELASPYCPRVRDDVFIDGTQPVQECPLHAPASMQESADRVVETVGPDSNDVKPAASASSMDRGQAKALPALDHLPHHSFRE